MTEITFRSDMQVDYVQHIGSDEMVARAARVSTGSDLIENDKIKGLIRYLVRERHTSTLEHCVVTVRVEAPIFVAREWMRHRTQCLSGSSVISFERPVDGGHYPYRLERLYKNWNDPAQKARIQKMRIRGMDEQTGEVVQGRVVDVFQSGVKEVYDLETDFGTVRGSKDHRVFTETGWKRIEDIDAGDFVWVADPRATDPAPEAVLIRDLHREWRPIPGWEGLYELSNSGAVRSLRNTRGALLETPKDRLLTVGSHGYLCVSLGRDGTSVVRTVHSLLMQVFGPPGEEGDEVRHVDGNKLNISLSNLKWGTSKQNSADLKAHGRQFRKGTRLAQVRHKSLQGEEQTFDIEVEGPHHNFFANGVVVHNSFNEISGRYAELAPVFYIPDENRPLVNAGSGAHPLIEFSTDDDLPLYAEGQHLLSYKLAWRTYSNMREQGVANEVARNVLPVGIYTQFYATANLNNWFKFLHLRDGNEGSPQYEIVEAANKVAGILEELYPVTYGVWAELNGRG